MKKLNLNILDFKILILLMVFSGLTGCAVFYETTVTKDYVTNDENKIYIIHQKQKRWLLYDVEIIDEHIHGKICSTIDESQKVRFVNIYIFSGHTMPDIENEATVIPFSEINTIEVNNVDKGWSSIYSIGAAISVFLLGFLLAWVIT